MLGWIAMLGNVEGVHPQHQPGRGVRHSPVFGKHDRHVDPRTDEGSGPLKTLGFTTQTVLVLFVGEASRADRSRGNPGRDGRGRSGPNDGAVLPDGHVSVRHPDYGFDFSGGGRRRSHGRGSQFLLPAL